MDPAHIGIVASVIVAAIVVIGFWVTFSEKISTANTQAANALAAAASAQAEARQSAKDLADFKEKVAREHVTYEAMQAFEKRIVTAVERIGDRFDQFFEPRLPTSRTRSGDANT